MALSNFAITYSLPDYGTPSKSFLHGSILDKIRVSITFDSDALIVAGAVFKFGLVPNSDAVYNGSDFKIADNKFLSRTTNTPQAFAGDIGGQLAPSLPIEFNTGTVSFNSLGGNSYEFIHEFILDPFPVDADLNGENTPLAPSIFSGAESPKYIFEFQLRDELINPVPVENTADYDLGAILLGGNVGYFDELLNGLPANYTKTSFTCEPSTLEDTSCSGVISGPSAVTASTVFKITYLSIPSSLDQNIDLLANYNHESILVNVGDAPASGTVISNLVTIANGNDVEFSFETVASELGPNYIFVVHVSNDAVTFDGNAVWLKYGVPASLFTGTGVAIYKPDGAAGGDSFRFLKWWNTSDIANAHNHLHAYRADDALCLFKFEALPPFTLERFRLAIVTDDGVLDNEEFSFPLASTSFPVEIDRGVLRSPSNDKKYIRISESSGVYDVSYGFQVWSNWIRSDVRFIAEFFGTVGGDPVSELYESPFFDLGQFDTSKNTLAEPRVLPETPPNNIQYIWVDSSGTPQSANNFEAVVLGQDTKIIATWQDDNLNDLQALESELRGYIGVNLDGSGKNTFRAIYDVYDSDITTPWKEVPGHTAGRAKVTKVDVKTATVEAILQWSKLQDAFGDAVYSSRICITPRLDKVDTFDQHTSYISFHFRGDDLRTLEYTMTGALPASAVIEVFGDVSFASLTFEFNNNPVTYAQLLVEMANGGAGDVAKITTSEAGLIEGGVLITSLIDAAAPASFSLVLPRDKGIDKDVAVWFKNKVTLTSITATGSSDSYAAIRLNPASVGGNTGFIFSLTDVAGLNGVISGLSEGDTWGLHLHANIETPTETNIITIEGSFDLPDLAITDIVDSYNNQKWRNIGPNCKLYDSALDCDVVNGYISPTFNDTFYVFVAFYVTNASQPQKLLVGNRVSDLGVADRGHWELACGAFGGQPDVRAFLSDNTSSGNDLVLVNRITYGYNIAQFVYGGTGLSADCKMIANGCEENVITTDRATPFAINNSANRLQIGARTNTAQTVITDAFGGGIVKLQIVHFNGAALPSDAQLRRDFMLGGIELSALPVGATLEVDIDFNKTGTASPTDNGVNGYTVTTLNGAAYAPFNGF